MSRTDKRTASFIFRIAPGRQHGSGRPRRSSVQVASLSLGDSRANQRCCLVRLRLALSLAQLGPEAGACHDPPAALLLTLPLRGDRERPSLEPSPKSCPAHSSSSTRSRAAASHRRGKRHRSGTPSFGRHGSRRVPRSRAGGSRPADAHARPRSGWTFRNGRRWFVTSDSPRRARRCP
jgi:hypothetical protein